MRQIVKTVGGLAAASANNIALAQQPTATAGFTLNGALATGGVAPLDKPRRVLITTTENDSAKTFTITGTDSQGRIISETMAGPNSTAGQSTLDYATVTSITTNSTVTANLTVGTNGVASSQALPLDHYGWPQDGIQVVVTGTINYTIQYTLDDPYGPASTVLNWFDFPDPNFVGATTNQVGGAQFLPAALRVLINSGTGTATITILQPGIKG